ncbi:hypothetical protein I4U23_013740 [Adineta vaga]|nr:hypothetical protein I4U23_013740 [Adineta vaga]
MPSTKSITGTKATGTETTEFTSIVSKSSVIRRRIDVGRLQNILLIWLDSSIDDSCADCQNTIKQLRQVITNIYTYTDADQCTQFIQTVNDNKIYLIVSGALGQHVVPCVHAMSQVDSIFVFCSNKKLHEQWAGEWPKVKGVYTGIPPICDTIKQLVQECELNSIPLSFLQIPSVDTPNKNFNKVDPAFVCSQVLKEISLTSTFDEKSIKEFLNRCHDSLYDNERELRFIEKLKRHYRDQIPIWWYTNHCFLYPMLNQTLRIMDVEMIMPISFFIASKDILTSLRFAQQVARNPDLVGVLFIMTIDPSQPTAPFALISDVSYNHTENEILFSMHAVFRIHDIKTMAGSNHIYEVRITLINQSDKDLRGLYEWIREETFPDEKGWFRLGMVLTKIGQVEKAEKLFNILLNQPSTEQQKAAIYHELGRVKYCQELYQKNLEEVKKKL